MDFLDPVKKRSNAIKLAIGHTLMGVLVLIGTFILVYQAYGFDFDRKTGEVIQNGLVFIDSAPDGAEIKINGEVRRDKTNTRLALPEGKYDLEINKEGYRTWRKSFDLDGGRVERFVYPTLFLNELSPSEIQTFNSPVTFMTQSPDRRWVLIGEKNNLKNLTEYDLNTLNNEIPQKQSVALPASLFTAATGDQTITLVEWSTDNNNLLVKHSWKGGKEFVVINRDQPAKSFNVNKLFGLNPSSIKLYDKKTDSFYMYDAQAKTLSLADVNTQQSREVASGVLAFEPHGKDVLALAISAKNSKKIQFVIREGAETFEVHDAVVASEDVDLAIARYDNAWYFATYDAGEQKTFIYKNPVEFIRAKPEQKPAPIMVLRSVGTVDDISFSQNTQFIVVRSGQHFSSYDNEYGRSSNYEINQPIDKGSEVLWMDGHRLLAHSQGKIVVFEFDGQNQQTLTDGLSSLPAVFDRDYTTLYSLADSSTSKKPVFNQTFLRLKQDR